ncbi:MAG: iron-containing alcohol dehydrogenase [Verrucomicrobiales bacterium]|nr:iron-containing alcohol dehydrogenase [Verrucomicrobiales bacterium]
MSAFEFATATRIVFGPGSIKEAAPAAKSFGARVLVVTGKTSKRAEALLAGLKAAHLEYGAFQVPEEPTTEMVMRGADEARKQRCEVVIAFGGGSVIDAGKAIAALITNDGRLLDYLEVIGKGKALEKSAAPLIAIPTTAGTGAEVTRNAVLSSPEHRVKVSLRSPFLLPRLAIVDPELTYDLPPHLTAFTGLDALTQLIEAYLSIRANPLTDALCVEGISRAARSLPQAFGKGGKEGREDMALASLFSGLALANSGLGAVHGFAAPIGGMFHAPHGAVCAALLPPAMHVNLRALRQRQPCSPILPRFDFIAGLLTGDKAAAAEDGIQWLYQLTRDFQVPGLREHGIREEHVAEVSAKAGLASSMKGNPLPLNSAEREQILREALG